MSDTTQPTPDGERMFPVMMRSGAWGEAYVPFAVVALHERQAEKNHGQSVAKLASRGGLSPCELAAVLEDRRWHKMKDIEAWRVIMTAVRGKPE